MPIKKVTLSIVIGILLCLNAGCAALLVGAAGGVIGTVVWLNGRLETTVAQPVTALVPAANAALRKMDLPVSKSVESERLAHIRAKTEDGRAVQIDMKQIDERTTRLYIRIGIKGDEPLSQDILDAIKKNLQKSSWF